MERIEVDFIWSPKSKGAIKAWYCKFYYYHCQTATKCKVRYRASEAHHIFQETLEKITAKKEVLDLYYRIMSDTFKKNGTDKTKQIKEVQADLDKVKQRLQNAQALMLDAELSAGDCKDIKNTLMPEMEKLERKKWLCSLRMMITSNIWIKVSQCCKI